LSIFTALVICTSLEASTPGETLYPRIINDQGNKGLQASNGESPASITDTDRQYFLDGYEHYSHQRYTEALEALFEFLGRKTIDDQDYEWAEFFFGMSLKRMGFSHAAVDSLTHVVTRKPNPKIVSYTLEVLESISRELPFDRDMLIDRALCDRSYGFVEEHVSDFIHYYQGEYDWEHGLFKWGDEHFAQIRENDFYYNKYLFKKALREIASNDIDQAIGTLKKVIQRLPDGDRLKDDVRKTLARLYYEKGKYSQADFLYQQIEMNIVEQAQNLLERAWIHYRMGNLERAMGLLYSFEAPSYKNSFTPEFYILKAFIYKDVCHYKTAMKVLEYFKNRYGDALDNIYSRGALQDNQAMLLVILNKPWIKRIWKFIELLDTEQERINQIKHTELAAYLNNLYSLKRGQYQERFRLLVRDEYEKMANDMLRFEEESHLLEYEIGTDMYQRISAISYHDETPQTTTENAEEEKREAIYRFQGEFWNDELDDYEVTLTNKCDSAEEWDIFFK
jgi:tetratricopeptide (TPR) repeat protein